MKKTYASSIVIALAALSAGQAMASADIIDPTTGVNITAMRAERAAGSSVTRAQVQAELFAYRAAHQADAVEPTLGFNLSELRNSTSTKTRAQVQAELAAHQAAHRSDAFDPTTGFQLR